VPDIRPLPAAAQQTHNNPESPQLEDPDEFAERVAGAFDAYASDPDAFPMLPLQLSNEEIPPTQADIDSAEEILY